MTQVARKVAKPAAVSLWGVACVMFLAGVLLDEPASRGAALFALGTSILIIQLSRSVRLEEALGVMLDEDEQEGVHRSG